MIRTAKTKKVIAAFDFDGTITTKDTLFDFIKFYHGRWSLWLGLLFLTPTLFLFKAKMISNERAKEKMLSFFFKGESYEIFLKECEAYKTQIDTIINSKAKEKIAWHQQKGHKVVILSASIDLWILPWAKSLGIETISTQLDIKNNIVTGKLSSKNCHGQEKVNRLLAVYPKRDDYILYAYGDSKGDFELLAFADKPFYRCF